MPDGAADVERAIAARCPRRRAAFQRRCRKKGSSAMSGEPGISRSRPCGSPAPNPKSDGVMTIRFMLLVKADQNTEAGVLPNKELVVEGLHPSSKDARLEFSGGERTVRRKS